MMINDILNQLAACSEVNNYSVYRIAVLDGVTEETRQLDLRQMNACMNSYSVAKAYTMTAIGMLVDDGVLDLEERVTDILVGE